MFSGNHGECFLGETNLDATGHIKSHLFVIILSNKGFVRNAIVVNIQTVRGGNFDNTVILRPGDHEFIIRESYVNYRLARIVSLDEIETKIKIGQATPKPALRDDIFQKICEGVCRSRFTPTEIIQMYKENLWSHF